MGKNLFTQKKALIRGQNDILVAIDSRKSVILYLLDRSAAFDTGTLSSLGFHLVLVLKGMLWLGSGRTLLRVSSASVLRVISPTLSGLHLSDCKDH